MELFEQQLTGRDDHLAGQSETIDDVVYHYNSLGFRGQEFAGEVGVVGDSFVFGLGVAHAFPHILSMDNMGYPSASNDMIVRHAIQYIRNYAPATVVVCWTYGYRREWIRPDGKVYRFKNMDMDTPDDYFWLMSELQNEPWDNYNYYKNKLLIESFCAVNNVKLLQIDNHVIVNDKKGADGKHPGQEWHNAVAIKVSEMLDA